MVLLQLGTVIREGYLKSIFWRGTKRCISDVIMLQKASQLEDQGRDNVTKLKGI
jgi:hypothetical protein